MAIHVSIDYVKGSFMRGFAIAKPAMNLLSERLNEARAFEGGTSNKVKPAKETSIPALIERHGRLETAVICAAVEHIAGAVLARDHGVRGAISRTMPFVSARAQDTFDGACDFLIDKAHTLVDAAVKVLEDNLEAASSSSAVVHTGVQAADAAMQKILGETYVEDAKNYIKDLPIRALEYSVVKAVEVYVPCEIKVNRMRRRSTVASVLFEGAVRSSFLGVLSVSSFFAFTHVYAISLVDDEAEVKAISSQPSDDTSSTVVPRKRWRRSASLFVSSPSITTLDTSSDVPGDEGDMEDNVDIISFSCSTTSDSDTCTANVSGSDACVLQEKFQEEVEEEVAFNYGIEVDGQKGGVEKDTNTVEEVGVDILGDGVGLEVVEPVVLVTEIVKPSYGPVRCDGNGEGESIGAYDGEDEAEVDGEYEDEIMGEVEHEVEDEGECEVEGDGAKVDDEGEFLLYDMLEGAAKDQGVEAMDNICVEGIKNATDIGTDDISNDVDGEVVLQEEMQICEATRRDGDVGFGLFPCVSGWPATSTVDIMSRTQATCQPQPTNVNRYGVDGSLFPVDAQSHVYPPSISSLVTPFDLFVSSTSNIDNASSAISDSTLDIDAIIADTCINNTPITSSLVTPFVSLTSNIDNASSSISDSTLDIDAIIADTCINNTPITTTILIIITDADTTSTITSTDNDNDNNPKNITDKNTITIIIDDKSCNQSLEVDTPTMREISNEQGASNIQGLPEAVDTQVYPEVEAEEGREKTVRGTHPAFEAAVEQLDQSQIEIDTVHAALVGDVSRDSEAEDHFVVPSFTVSMPCLTAVAESASFKEALVFNTSVSFDCRLGSAQETVESEGVCTERDPAATTSVAMGVEPPHSSLTATAAAFVPRAQAPSSAGIAGVATPAHWAPAPRVAVTLEKPPVRKSRTASATGRRARHLALMGKGPK